MTPVTSMVCKVLIILCDKCGTDITVVDDAELPGEWRAVYMQGWLGAMHACSDPCEVDIRRQYKQKKEEVTPCE